MCVKYAFLKYVTLWLTLGALVHGRPTMASKPGDQCKPRTIFCADGDGQSPRYLKCVHGRLVEEYCVDNSICIGSKDTTVFCAVDDSSPPKETTMTIRPLAHSLPPATHSKPYAPSWPTQAATPPPPLLMPESKQSSVRPAAHGSPIVGNAKAVPPNYPQSQPPLHLAAATAPVSSTPPQHGPVPPALQPQIPQNIRPAPASSRTYLQPPPTAQVPLLSIKPTLAQPAPVMFNHRPTPMFEAHPASLLAEEGGEMANDIDGIAASDVLSVVGEAILAHHPELMASGNSKPNMDSGDQEDAVPSELPATRPFDPSVELPATRLFDPSVELPATRLPERPAVARGGPGACTPGSFICEAHGLRPGYFACDSIGVALPASCGLTDVCYQHRQTIVCGAPGRNF
ncbi:hypothetical protein BX667DRAFT_502398 [Coemansia mojavensis]|nr:hypothetical protein BX667DRAFT_502398 [Coemansia mojavensis]